MINVDLIYPIGSIYLSLNDINPNKLFGGTWERIKGKTLVGVDESDTDFKTSKLTGGEKTHKLTIAEMPSHTHALYIDAKGTTIPAWHTRHLFAQSDSPHEAQLNNLTSTGNSQPHNNMQPYYTCFIWYRTA